MNKREQLFENICCNLYDDVHAGFVIEFQSHIFPIIEDIIHLDDLSNLNVGLYESKDKLDSNQIEAIFKSAAQLLKSKSDMTTETAKTSSGKVTELKDNAISQVGLGITKMVDKYQDLPPVKDAERTFDKLKQKLVGGDASLSSTIDTLNKTMIDVPRTTNIIIGALTAIASLSGSSDVGSALLTVSNALSGDIQSADDAQESIECAFDNDVVVESEVNTLHVMENDIVESEVNTLGSILGL